MSALVHSETTHGRYLRFQSGRCDAEAAGDKSINEIYKFLITGETANVDTLVLLAIVQRATSSPVALTPGSFFRHGVCLPQFSWRGRNLLQVGRPEPKQGRPIRWPRTRRFPRCRPPA